MSKAAQYTKGTICLLIGILFLGCALYLVQEVILLGYGGKSIQAKVVQYRPETCGRKTTRRTCHYHALYGAGKKFKLDLKERHRVGTRVPITYLPNEPSMYRQGKLDGSPLEYIYNEIGILEGFVFFMGAFWFYTGVSWYRSKD